MKQQIVNILGAEWTIISATEEEDKSLKEMDGYTDKTIREIVVLAEARDGGNTVRNFEEYRKCVVRHEIIHAFLFERGLPECWDHRVGHDETYIDWIAAQFPKLQKVFQEADAL